MEESIFTLIVVALTTAFGFIINDFTDLEKDLINHAHRELPTGRLKRTEALVLSILLALLSIGISFMISNYVVVVNLATLFLLGIYNFINNRYGIVANFIVAFCSALAILIAKTNLQLDLIFYASVSTFLLVMSREIIFDMEDIAGDTAVGKTSVPIVFGNRKSMFIAILLLILHFSISLAAAYKFQHWPYFIFVCLLSSMLSFIGCFFYFSNQTKATNDQFALYTRVAFLMIIPALLAK